MMLSLRWCRIYNVVPLQHAVGCEFCMCWLLHFCKFLTNPNIDLELDCIFGKPMKRRFQWYIVHMEIFQPFMYESNTFLCESMPLKPRGWFRDKKLLKPPFPCSTSTPSNTSMPGPTPLTIPNGIWIQSAVSPQYTFRTHRRTDRPTNRRPRRQVYTISTYARYTDREKYTKNKIAQKGTEVISWRWPWPQMTLKVISSWMSHRP